MNILSTKVLEQVSIDDLNPIADVLDYDILLIEPINPSSNNFHKNIIFTSYKGTLRGLEVLGDQAKDHHFFCVGKKSEEYLKSRDLEVYGFAYYSKDLAELLVENLGNSSFSYLCGKDRLDTLPEIFNSNNVSFEEVYTYRSEACENIPEGDFDIYLWFSPKGVSCFKGQVNPDAVHICIGETTARTAMELFEKEKVFYPELPRMEDVMKLAREKAIEINLIKCTQTVAKS